MQVYHANNFLYRENSICYSRLLTSRRVRVFRSSLTYYLMVIVILLLPFFIFVTSLMIFYWTSISSKQVMGPLRNLSKMFAILVRQIELKQDMIKRRCVVALHLYIALSTKIYSDSLNQKHEINHPGPMNKNSNK